MISVYDLTELRSDCDRRGVYGRTLRAFLVAFFKRGEPWAGPMARVPDESRLRIVERLAGPCLKLVARLDSQIDGASKLVFEVAPGRCFETVILRYPSGRTSLCLSSQVGCALRCRFCATGQMKRVEDLTRDQILGQVSAAQQQLAPEGRTVDNVVFMGMGEPFLNEAAVFAAIGVLTDGDAFNLPEPSVLVSTVLLPDVARRFQAEFPRVNVAVSLHSSRQHVRAKLMPIAARHSLDEIKPLLGELASTRRRGVMIEYVVLRGVNDSPEDADHLAEFLGELRCHVNLIPYNPIDGVELEAAPDDAIDAMSDRLRARGLCVTRRRSLGRDIEAACGQLIQRGLPIQGDGGELSSSVT